MKFKILMLSVFMGLSVSIHANADTGSENIDTQQCIIQGFVNLTMSGDVRSGNISGEAGGVYVNFFVNSGYIDGFISGTNVNLQIRNDFGTQYSISGWINRTYVNWQGYDKRWNLYQDCIPQ